MLTFAVGIFFLFLSCSILSLSPLSFSFFKEFIFRLGLEQSDDEQCEVDGIILIGNYMNLSLSWDRMI